MADRLDAIEIQRGDNGGVEIRHEDIQAGAPAYDPTTPSNEFAFESKTSTLKWLKASIATLEVSHFV